MANLPPGAPGLVQPARAAARPGPHPRPAVAPGGCPGPGPRLVVAALPGRHRSAGPAAPPGPQRHLQPPRHRPFEWLAAEPAARRAVFRPAAVVVLLGRGPAIAAATTTSAAVQLRRDPSLPAYVSGDARSTAERLVQLGVAPSRIAGDSCARTTWENATRTAAWLRQHHPGAPVLLITDPWQLPRATRAFARQGLQVHPLAAEPPLTAPERNRLALREAAATVLVSAAGTDVRLSAC
jgi:uncharacterized SAM-binding protein YcdF (DUF218 family)